jgi:MFS transporter, DHA1 family, multidrug resistance protein
VNGLARAVPAASSSLRSSLFTLLVAAMVALPPLSIDMVLPALPSIASSLRAPIGQAGLAISVFLAGFAISQLVLGPLSDRLGRRPVLLASCAGFSAAGLGAAAAGSVSGLLAFRLVQGIGAGGCMVVIFAVVRDLFEGDEVRSRLATANAIMGIAPMVAPTVGALFLSFTGWRGLFGFLGAGGAALLLGCGLRLEESIGENRRRVGASELAASYWKVLSVRPVLGCALVAGLTFGLLQAYVIGSSFLFLGVLHVTPRTFALVFAVIASGQVWGATGAAALARRGVSHVTVLLGGILLGLTGSAILLLLAVLGRLRVATAIPTLLLVTTALGLVTPTAAHGVLAPMPHVAGTASAVLGFVRMSGGALASALVSLSSAGSPFAIAVVMTLLASGALVVWLAAVSPGRPEASHPPPVPRPSGAGAPCGDPVPVTPNIESSRSPS